MATPTSRLKLKKQTLGSNLNQWGLSGGLNGAFDQVDILAGYLEVNLGSATSYTFGTTNYATTGNEHMYRAVKFSGSPASGVTVNIPAVDDFKFVENATGQTITFSNGSTTATLANTFTGYIRTNGSSVITVLTLPDGANVKTVADNIASVNQVATDSASVIAVAGKSTEIGRLGTTDAVADMALLGTTANVTAQSELGTSANVTAQGILGTSANVVAQGILGTSSNVVAQGHLGTSANVTAMGNLGTSTNVTNMASLAPQAVRDDMSALGASAVRADMDALAATAVLADMAALAETDVLADMAALGDAAVVTDLDLLGTTANVTAMGHLGTSANVTAMGNLGTSANVTNMSNLGTSANVTNMNTLADIQDGTVATNAITIAATNSNDITDYSKTYLGPKSSSPTQRNDGTALQAGDLVFRTDLDQMQVRNAANNAWAAVAVTASNFLTVSNNLNDLASATTARTNLGLDPLLAAKAPLASPTFTGTLASPTVNASTALQIGGVAISASAAEINYNDLTTLGTTEASKTVTADANGVVTFDNGKIEESTAITSSSNAAALNLRLGDNFTHTLSENVTYTFSNPASNGKVSAFTLKVTQDSSARVITWPASVDWAAATAPTLSATSGAVDVFVFATYDGGTTYYGFTAGQAMN